MTFADLVKERRRRQFLTQRALAAAVGVSLNTVQRWELGISTPHAGTQRKLLDALAVEPETLLAAIAETAKKDAA